MSLRQDQRVGRSLTVMKWSKYNLLFESEKHGHLLYNSLTNTFAQLDSEAFRQAEQIRAGPDRYNIAQAPALYLQLVLAKVLIDEGEEEELLRVIRLRRLQQKFDDSAVSVTIIPTLWCNFACSYCYEQSRRPIHMSQETEQRLIQFLRRFEHAKQLQIDWFGGEPLLRFESMCRISRAMDEHGLPWSANLTTNGYLLDGTVIAQLDDLRIRSIQVTIDGREKIHDTRRPLISGAGSFRTILANLDQLLARWHGELIVRVNIDKNNQHEFFAVRELFHQKYGNTRVKVTPGIVIGAAFGLADSDCHFDHDENCRFRISAYRTHGVDDFQFYPHPRFGCVATQQSSFVIGPEGETYRCYLDVGKPERVVGSLADGSTVNEALYAGYMLADSFDDPVCRDCFYLPLCDGGCAHARLTANAKDNVHTCVEYKDALPQWLEICFEIKQNQIAARRVADNSSVSS